MTTFTGKRVKSYRTSVREGMFALQLIDEQSRGSTIEHLLDKAQAVTIARAIFEARDANLLDGGQSRYPTAFRPSEDESGWRRWDGSDG